MAILATNELDVYRGVRVFAEFCWANEGDDADFWELLDAIAERVADTNGGVGWVAASMSINDVVCRPAGGVAESVEEAREAAATISGSTSPQQSVGLVVDDSNAEWIGVSQVSQLLRMLASDFRGMPRVTVETMLSNLIGSTSS